MKQIAQLLLVVLFGAALPACQSSETGEKPQQDSLSTPEPPEPTFLDLPELHPILDSIHLQGSVLIFDPQENAYKGSHFERIRQDYLPASTFKIPNSIIGLETGVVEDLETIFKWDGEPRYLERWEKDLTFYEAYQQSCLPCYQELARNAGQEKMQEYVDKLNFGRMVITDTTYDAFWVVGESKINQMEQIDFLRRLVNKELPIAERTYALMREIMVLDSTESYTLRGKTGWSVVGEQNIGWFVGYVEKGEEVYFFATNVEPTPEYDMDDFFGARKRVTMQTFSTLAIL